MTLSTVEPGALRAQELYGDYWFNSDPVPLMGQRGGVILLDFWDYSCSAALRMLPYLRDWCSKYSSSGLTIIGVHSPRFPFGRDPENVQKALQREGIRYPVVMDNEMLLWSRYGNRTWPTQQLIDRNGFIRFVNAGGGSPTSVEHALQSLLVDAGQIGDIPPLTEPAREIDRPGAVCYRATPEIFSGYLRGGIGNADGYFPESELHYSDPGIYVEGRFYVVGDWSNGREGVELLGAGGGQIVCRYSAREVDVVISAPGTRGLTVDVLQDGEQLPEDSWGEDVTRSRAGRASVQVKGPRAYRLVKNPEHREHVLTLAIPGAGVSLYSLAFGPGVIPELISG